MGNWHISCNCLIWIYSIPNSAIKIFNLLQGIPTAVFASETYCHFISGNKKLVLIMTDYKSVISLSRAKSIPHLLRERLVGVTVFNITVAHIPGKAKAVSYLLSRLQAISNGIADSKLTNKIPMREKQNPVQARLQATQSTISLQNIASHVLHAVEIKQS